MLVIKSLFFFLSGCDANDIRVVIGSHYCSTITFISYYYILLFYLLYNILLDKGGVTIVVTQ